MILIWRSHPVSHFARCNTFFCVGADYHRGACAPPKSPSFPRGLVPSDPPPLITRNMSPGDHDTCTMIVLHSCIMIIVHACTTIMVHARTMIIVNAWAMIIVRACTMMIVHAYVTMVMVHACTIVIVHACN